MPCATLAPVAVDLVDCGLAKLGPLDRCWHSNKYIFNGNSNCSNLVLTVFDKVPVNRIRKQK